MITITPRRRYLDRMRATVASPQTLAAAQADTSPPDPVVQWLGSLMSLHGVPFNYLVADEGILPAESIRFFQVDPNWIDALVAGATSLGRSSSTMEAHDAVHTAGLHAAGAQAARRLRAGEDAASSDADSPSVLTGFLLRSAVVSGWPGLEVAAYDAQMNMLPIFRMDRLSPTILLFIVTGRLASVNIYEPPEGLHFGVEEAGAKRPRYVTVPAGRQGVAPGQTIGGVTPVEIDYRAPGVLKVNALAARLQAALDANRGNDDPATGKPRAFTSAEFAVQMVEGTQSVLFKNVPAPGLAQARAREGSDVREKSSSAEPIPALSGREP